MSTVHIYEKIIWFQEEDTDEDKKKTPMWYKVDIVEKEERIETDNKETLEDSVYSVMIIMILR